MKISKMAVFAIIFFAFVSGYSQNPDSESYNYSRREAEIVNSLNDIEHIFSQESLRRVSGRAVSTTTTKYDAEVQVVLDGQNPRIQVIYSWRVKTKDSYKTLYNGKEWKYIFSPRDVSLITTSDGNVILKFNGSEKVIRQFRRQAVMRSLDEPFSWKWGDVTKASEISLVVGNGSNGNADRFARLLGELKNLVNSKARQPKQLNSTVSRESSTNDKSVPIKLSIMSTLQQAMLDNHLTDNPTYFEKKRGENNLGEYVDWRLVKYANGKRIGNEFSFVIRIYPRKKIFQIELNYRDSDNQGVVNWVEAKVGHFVSEYERLHKETDKHAYSYRFKGAQWKVLSMSVIPFDAANGKQWLDFKMHGIMTSPGEREKDYKKVLVDINSFLRTFDNGNYGPMVAENGKLRLHNNRFNVWDEMPISSIDVALIYNWITEASGRQYVSALGIKCLNHEFCATDNAEFGSEDTSPYLGFSGDFEQNEADYLVEKLNDLIAELKN